MRLKPPATILEDLATLFHSATRLRQHELPTVRRQTIVYGLRWDGWQSGRLRTLGKRVFLNRNPGFESLPIRGIPASICFKNV